jgi:AcrR family transcriptional regulator
MSYQSISDKASRTYRSELRQQQAEQTRSRVVAAAAELFAAEGYPRTTFAKIAAAAGVSAETVQGHGPKAALMVAALQYAAVGVIGEENVLNVDIGRKFIVVDDYSEAVAMVIEGLLEVHGRTAHLASALLGAANSDPELEQYVHDLITSITLQFRRLLELFRDRGWLRDDVPFDELVETLAVIGSVETYLRIIHRDGWSVAAYEAWCRRMLTETVFLPLQAD